MSAREREGEWNGVATWGSKEEAREAIERAMAVGYRGPSTVGTTLCATLCDAFEVPGFWRR